MSKKMTGSEILIECLKREGVEIIFGFPGGVVLGLFDKLFDADIEVVLTRHEQAAAHAADGYARASGKVGVCLSTSGPGATNLVTGIATAHMDSVPIVALTGQVDTSLIGGDAFQEADITGITRPITKHNFLIDDIKRVAWTVRAAFHIARTGRPGPVLIDLPKNITMGETEFVYPEEIDLPGYKPTYRGNMRQIKTAAKVINEAKRPLIYAGGGVIISGATKELKELAYKVGTPVTLTLLGLGGFPGTDDLFLEESRHRRLAEKGEEVEEGFSADIRQGRQDHKTAVRCGGDLSSHKRQGHHHNRGRPEPDVGCAVLQVRRAA